jgi:pimeloyl-ACP methyl ester carboxylesterase
MYVGQTWLLFPTALARIARVQLPSSTQHLEVRTPDGESLKGIRTPSREEAAQNAPTLLGFGGNAWNAKATALTLHRLFPDRDIVAFHYRGYAPSKGRPSAEALRSDSLAIFDSLRQGQIEEPIVAVGFSIGSGVAAYLAQHRPVAGLVLVTPFDSLEALALDLYWWAAVGLLFRHRMRTIEFVRDSLVPTALITAESAAIALQRSGVRIPSAPPESRREPPWVPGAHNPPMASRRSRSWSRSCGVRTPRTRRRSSRPTHCSIVVGAGRRRWKSTTAEASTPKSTKEAHLNI